MPFFKFKKTKKSSSSNSNSNSKSSKNNSKTKSTKKKDRSIDRSIDNRISNEIENNNKQLFDKSLSKYIPPINSKQVRPKYWELPNRKNFFNWVLDTFQQYETGNTRKQVIEKPLIDEQTTLSNIQRLTRDYLQGESPVRGLLLYIGLGHGKTCAAIAIAEAILTKKEVIVFSKANLEPNFRKEIRKCGTDYVKTMSFWVFKQCSPEAESGSESGAEYRLAIDLGIPKQSIIENGGVYFIDFTKTKSNYNELNDSERTKLDNQIEHIVNKRFKFIHFDSPRKWAHIKENEFDDKIVIVDEVHNIGNTMASQAMSADKYYNLFMNAKNPKYVFLSGTPIVNSIFEITKIFNILRGYMFFLEIKFKSTYDINVDFSKITYLLKKNINVDQIIVNKGQKTITVTKNPDNFVTNPDGKGVIYKPDASITFEVFRDEVNRIIQSMGYKFTISENRTTSCFETDREQFEKMFYNQELNKLKKVDLIKRRIAGLTSFYEFPNKATYPVQLPINTVLVPMSDFQFDSYERYRHEEIQKDKFNKRKQDDDKQQQSTYRIKSRLACNFVFPTETGSPYDSKELVNKIELIERLGDMLTDFDITPEDAEDMEKKELDKEIKLGYVQLLDRDKAKYLDIKNGSLAKHSPKYLTMILNIQKERGKQLVYSCFRNLIGLTIFSYALIQTGSWAPFRIIKRSSTGGKATKNDTVWELDEREDEKGKNKYMFYTGGDKDKEMRAIYINIYNSTWDKLPPSCSHLVTQLKKIHPNNYYGEVIKMIMTTKSGAEGLDLKEVRYIHIGESYWQHVLIDQLIGRGVRNMSHMNLVPADRTVEVFIYMSTITPKLVKNISHIDVRTTDVYKYPNPALADKAFKIVSSDEHLYLTAERKRVIINEFQKLMKETAFDCALNYSDNIRNPVNKGLVCMDYPKKNRDEYLFTPTIDDTIDTIDNAQEKTVIEQYKAFQLPSINKILYRNVTPNKEGKTYIYDENPAKKIRLPKAVGEIRVVNGVKQVVLFKKNKSDKANKSDKSDKKKKK